MSNTQQSNGELSPLWYKVQVIFYLGLALVSTHFARREPAGDGLMRFYLPLLCCVIAAFNCVQLARLRARKSLNRPLPLLFRYIGLAFCVDLTYSSLAVPGAGLVRILFYLGLTGFWVFVVIVWQVLKKQDREAKAAEHSALQESA